ncbi:hypothetical protein N7474_000221 [Penicillium riverlandense]|uniref:uncharacterized protein n=1 Tax=Penicillium riverlandense TaxID=1903569 RepID=UPI002549741D|nr:uncharacterized protein N7474_000221 [Penicillium riverlandense]KAJ5831910.1 hypothetical protein N7474_000221 [Penicillium riverlandense]
MIPNWHKALWALFLLASVAHAQFNFFEQMFGGNQGQERQQQNQNAPSDSSRYQKAWDGSKCSNYLCPGTLACVHVPHHCPCPHPDVEEKVELGEGSAICVSRGGFKDGEATRKIELARKGAL